MKIFVVACWIMFGFYIGCSGWFASTLFKENLVTASNSSNPRYLYNGIDFRDLESFKLYMQEKQVAGWCSWVLYVPEILMPLVTASGFGIAGGAAKSIKMVVIDKKPLGETPYMTSPILGMFLGLAFFFLSVLLPPIFTVGKTPVRTETLVALSFLGGIFQEPAYKWVHSFVGQIFKTRQNRN